MNHFRKAMSLAALWGVFNAAVPATAQDQSAAGLAARLSAAIEDGGSSARLTMTIKPAGGTAPTALQIRLKARRTSAKSEIVYQVLQPKERKGEALLLRLIPGRAPEGSSFVPPDSMTTLDATRLNDPALGSDLTYLDIIENFFRWEKQALVGRETIDRVDCLILESKPGGKDASPYGSVKSWIDPEKLVALRVEKYDGGGKLALRIDTTKVAKDDTGRHTPATLVVRRTQGGGVTEIEGSNIRHDITLSDRDFTVPTFTDLRIPR